jgi:hypothetical protein
VVVEAAPVEQLLMIALLDDLAVVDDQHPVGVADGAQAVGDDKAGAAFHQAQQRLLDAGLGAGVDAAGGLVQDQDGGLGQDGARNGQQLALALAEVAGALGQQGLVALRQLPDEVVGVCQLAACDASSSLASSRP